MLCIVILCFLIVIFMYFYCYVMNCYSYVYVLLCYVYVLLCLCILIVMFMYCCAMCSYFYVYIFLLLCMFHSLYSVSLCRSVYCLYVNVYCTAATGWLPNCSHKNSDRKEARSVFHYFCPGLPVWLTLCPIKQCSTLSWMVSVHAFAKAAYRAVGVRADYNPKQIHLQVMHPGHRSLQRSDLQYRHSHLTK